MAMCDYGRRGMGRGLSTHPPPTTHRAGGDEQPFVLGHGGPPEVLLEEMKGSGETTMAGDSGRVPPLKDL